MGTEGPATRFAGAPCLRSISTHRTKGVTDGWRLARTEPGDARTPGELDQRAPEWLEAAVPGTVASALRRAGRLPALERCDDLDASDWWFRTTLVAPEPHEGERMVLGFGGLATLAEAWLDGEPIGSSRNMFRALELDVTGRLRGRHGLARHDLVVRFPALAPELARRHPRPRWKVPLVECQALRWFRTTLLGRLPGWCPPVHAVGPWQPVVLEQRRVVEVVEGDVMPMTSPDGDRLVVDLVVRALGAARVHRADLVTVFGREPLELQELETGTWRVLGAAPATGAARWWPHTHGPQPRYAVGVTLGTSKGPAAVDLGDVAFRELEVDRSDDGFAIVCNGVRIFCRGANWTPADLVTLRADGRELRRRLTLVRDAGMNMLRVSGVMAYEDARFHAWCDALGVLVWQDFMFARLDYPADDAAFRDEVRAEALEVIAARRRRASTAVWCGNSEVAQTAAMLGFEAGTWSSPLFDEVIPAALAAAGHDAPYLPSTPIGGALPFTPASGTSHYFGVGAMLRPLEDARRAGVRFATESLGLANVGEGPELPSDVDWPSRIPRDAGAAWDFEDVRDHYAARLFGGDPVTVRHSDPERYVAMARIASAEVMRRTFAEWRRARSSCAGALVWLLADVAPGCGWGILDARGTPKSPWYALRRVLAPRTVFFTDEGLGGLLAHVANDGPDVLDGALELTLFRDAHLPIAHGACPVRVAPHSIVAVAADAVLGRFTDVNWAYRFGPPSHDVVLIELRDRSGTLLASDLYLPQGPSPVLHDVELTARVVHADAEGITLELGCERLAYAVRVEAGDWFVQDNYVHVPPGRRVVVCAAGPADLRPASVVARAFNARGGLRIDVPAPVRA